MEDIATVRETPELLLKHLTAKSVETFMSAYGVTTDEDEMLSIIAGLSQPRKGTRNVAGMELMLREDLDMGELARLFANPELLVTAFDEGRIGVKPTTIDLTEVMRCCNIVRIVITAYGGIEQLREAGVNVSGEATLSDISSAVFCYLATKSLASGELD